MLFHLLQYSIVGFSLIEWVGFISGIWGIYLGIKEKLLYFPVSLIYVVASFFVFFHQQLYSDSLQQIVFFILINYGWLQWLRGQKANGTKAVTHASKTWVFVLIGLVVVLTAGMGYFFKTYTSASLPYWDALATSLSFAAQYLLAEKKIENWLVWIDVNIIYIGIYLYKGLPLYAILFFVYMIMAVIGYFKWQTHLINNESA